MNKVPLVSVVCTTYNHEKYIRQTLDGFIIQKTSFPIEIIVHDDASTDSTALIIKEYEKQYPNLFHNIYRLENWYSHKKNIWKYLFQEVARGKYIALCEGDDYWIDPLKLQRQVDFLEAHEDYGLVHTNFCFYSDDTGRVLHNGSKRYNIKNGYIFKELFSGCWIKTLTVCFRKVLVNELPVLTTDCFQGDLFYFYEISLKSKVYFDNYESGVYRVLKESASHNVNYDKMLSFFRSLQRLDYYYADKYNLCGIDRYKLDKKWFIWDLKYFLRIADYDHFCSLTNVHFLSFNRKELGLYICFLFCQIKVFFYAFSLLLRIKCRIFRILKKGII